MAEDWKAKLKSQIDAAKREGRFRYGATYILEGLIEALHSKGVLSAEDRTALLQTWDEVDRLKSQDGEDQQP